MAHTVNSRHDWDVGCNTVLYSDIDKLCYAIATLLYHISDLYNNLYYYKTSVLVNSKLQRLINELPVESNFVCINYLNVYGYK